eukprot:SAG31_NODE_875_length_11316_cov_8.924044_8_plen_179_part_00
MDDPHEGKRKCESNWDIHRIHWKKNRFIYDLYYKNKEISKELYDWMVRLKIADAALISKWRKPGYEILCSTLAVSASATNFGTASICRVPLRQRGGIATPAVSTGCVSCASGDGVDKGPIWWCDRRPNMVRQRPDETQKPNKRARAPAQEVPDEGPPLDDAVAARLAMLKAQAGPEVD